MVRKSGGTSFRQAKQVHSSCWYLLIETGEFSKVRVWFCSFEWDLKSNTSVEDILCKSIMAASFWNYLRPPNLLFISVSHSAEAEANK